MRVAAKGTPRETPKQQIWLKIQIFHLQQHLQTLCHFEAPCFLALNLAHDFPCPINFLFLFFGLNTSLILSFFQFSFPSWHLIFGDLLNFMGSVVMVFLFNDFLIMTYICIMHLGGHKGEFFLQVAGHMRSMWILFETSNWVSSTEL